MAKEFALSIVAPDREVVAENVTSVVAPGSSGYFGVMAGHLPLVAALKPGLLEYLDPQNQRRRQCVSCQPRYRSPQHGRAH